MPLEIVFGRILLATMFVHGGLLNTLHEHDNQVRAARSIGVPFPRLMVRVNGALMFVGGILMATGLFPQLGALILFVVMVPTTIAGHPFWREDDWQARRQQFRIFLKNVGAMGGLAVIYGQGPVAALYGW